MSRRTWRLVLIFLTVVLDAAKVWSSDKPNSPNIVLITVDTTRADRMGFLGSSLGLTPNLDAVARQAATFSRAYAHVPLTTPSHATIFTGTYPQFNQLGDLGTELGKDLPYLPDLLRARGYTTAAFVGSQVLDPQSAAAPGFDRGFDTYDAGFHSRREGESRYSSEERRAEVVVEHAVAWLKQPRSKPFFLWVHVYDPHDPYDPPEPFKTKYAKSPYDGEIAYVDSELGKSFAQLKAAGLYDSSIIAIVADHGEAFGEHGEESHGFFLYDETLHVPLVIKLPGVHPRVQIDRRVGLVDVAPTLLAAAGGDVPRAMQGVSLLPAINGKVPRDAPERLAYAETNYPQRAFGWSWLRSLRTGKYLYIDAPRRELYDQSADPKALHNLAESQPAIAETLQAQLDDFRRQTESKGGMRPAALSPEQAEKLQGLGYVMSAGNAGGTQSKDRGPDPKDKIGVANLLHHALLAVDQGRYQEAVPQLEEVLKDDPNLELANLQLGVAFNRLEKYVEAVPWLRKAIELNAKSGKSQFELGVALGETGDWAGAATHLEAAVSFIPDSDDLRYYLAMAYDKIGKQAEAEKNFREALRLNPEHYQANLYLGRLLGMQNRAAEALAFVQKAVSLQPQSPDAHKFLANVYVELGRTEDARHEQTEAERLSHP